MTAPVLQRRRTALDAVVGFLLVLAGLVILGDTVLATTLSVLFVGWLALFSGMLTLVSSLFRLGHHGFWSSALSGGLLTVLGLLLLRNTAAAALTLSRRKPACTVSMSQ